MSRLLDMIEDTTQQLYDTKRTQHDLVTTVSSEQQGSISMTTRCEELEERLREEVEAKEYLAMELHKAEGRSSHLSHLSLTCLSPATHVSLVFMSRRLRCY